MQTTGERVTRRVVHHYTVITENGGLLSRGYGLLCGGLNLQALGLTPDRSLSLSFIQPVYIQLSSISIKMCVFCHNVCH